MNTMILSGFLTTEILFTWVEKFGKELVDAKVCIVSLKFLSSL